MKKILIPHQRIQSSKSASTGIRVSNSFTNRDHMTKSFERAVSRSIAYKKRNGFPIARFDPATERAYLEYPDGRRKYVETT